jgi:hypothetical protein
MNILKSHGRTAFALLLVACGGRIADTQGDLPGTPVDRDTAALLNGPAWPQWGQNQQHTGYLGVVGQAFKTTYLNYTYDPLVPTEVADADGDLLAHYMTPLTESDAVYMETKSGTYSPNTYATQTWGIVKFKWIGGQLVKQWQVDSDWKAIGSQNDFWEPVFHAVLANGFLYMPGANGTIVKVNKNDGSVVSRINPMSNADPNTWTVGPLTADKNGNVYYDVLRMAAQGSQAARPADEQLVSHKNPNGWKAPQGSYFYGRDALDSWLVKVTPTDAASSVSISVLVPDAPKKTDNCEGAFSGSQLPWPPSPDAYPSTGNCGTQRVAVSAAPAVGPDGTIYIITRSHYYSRYGYLVAVNPDLTPKWDASLRDRLHDGCGVPHSEGGQLEPNGSPNGCRVGANYGVDPGTNRPGGGRVLDDSSSSPAVAPDGSIFYGAYTAYNFFQGHLMHFDASGSFLNAYGFGWDTTPGFYAHDGTYSVITKDNHYGATGAFCWSGWGAPYNETYCPSDRDVASPDYPEGYFISQLSPNLKLEWQYASTNQQSCSRDASGNVTCVTDHPKSFEWCVNAPAIDAKGTVYANSEDGWLYAIGQGGTVKDKMFQQLALGAAYTPASLGTDGKVYSQNSGHLFVIGK